MLPSVAKSEDAGWKAEPTYDDGVVKIYRNPWAAAL